MTACNSTFALRNSRDNQTTIDITASGDVTVDSDVENAPDLIVTNVNKTVDVSSEATVKGAVLPPTFSATDCSAVSVGAPGGTVPGGGGGGGGAGGGSTPSCSLSADVPTISIKKHGGTTGVVHITVGTTSNVSVSGASNLQFSPSSQIVTSSGSTAFTIQSTNNTRGTFRVTFSSDCDTTDVMVTVTN
jgi:hypothetical protein